MANSFDNSPPVSGAPGKPATAAQPVTVGGWPSWRYGPNDQAAIFHSADDVPEGWYDHPSLVPFEPEENLSEINELRAAYKERFNKRPFNGWDEATLREKLA